MSTTETETQTAASINDTVQQALQTAGYGSYMTYAQPVIAALTEREQAISQALLDQAEEMDIDQEDIREALEAAGLSVKEPEVEEDEETEESSDTGAMGRIEQMLTSLTGRIDSLTEFARSNGYRGN